MDKINKLIVEYKREIQERQKALDLHYEYGTFIKDKITFKAKKEVLLRVIKDLEGLNKRVKAFIDFEKLMWEKRL